MLDWEAELNRWIIDGGLPGGALEIRHRDDRYIAACGSSTTSEGERETTPDTMFDLASLTKVVGTLPGLLLLVDREGVNFDDGIRRYLPEFGHDGVTIRHLLTHTGYSLP